MRGTVVLLPNDYFRVVLEPGDQGMKHYQWISYPYQSSSSMSQYQYHKAKPNDQHQQSHLEGCRHSTTFLHTTTQPSDMTTSVHSINMDRLFRKYRKASALQHTARYSFIHKHEKLCKKCKCRGLRNTCKNRGFTWIHNNS